MIPLLEYAKQLKLTETEKEIVEYFERRTSVVAYMNLQDISRALYTSSATIVRFCQKLGLGGFNDFKYQLRKELKASGSRIYQSDDYIKHSIALFQDNIDSIDLEKAWQIALLATSKRPLYIYGSSLSSLPAKYLQVVLNTLDFPSIVVEWGSLLDTLVDNMSGDTVLLILSASGRDRYLPVLKKAEKRKLTTVLITSNPDSLLIPYSTIYICTNDVHAEYHYTDVNSRMGFFTVIQILIEMASSIKESQEKKKMS